ncbi:hypothetical protein MTZ49_03645 [Entomomonas sp. E2T0]|uniref:hypothetical protein n=1 Tax=Entomomonas sp. E2T0 TaxID=2930213 RepID=UPI0022282863|nr:hypothetical protein [Entomomonas sp. E2T0]UYZ84667.1 hypothetical protein MTZ49_03645 [Entomomonas sp. E2T0]
MELKRVLKLVNDSFLFILFLFIISHSNLYAQTSDDTNSSLTETLKSVAEEMNKKLPMCITRNITLISLMADKNTLIYNYSYTKLSSEESKKMYRDIKEELESKTIQFQCLFDRKVNPLNKGTIITNFYGNDNQLGYSIKINKVDCDNIK